MHRYVLAVAVCGWVLGCGPPQSLSTATNVKEQALQRIDVRMTLYGWPDNDPPGPAIDHPVIHSRADGTGTYDDPVTFAAQRGVWPFGTIMYVPRICKYIILEDTCATCRGPHVDVWLNSDDTLEQETLDCEDYWTENTTQAFLNPPGDLPVFEPPLFDPDTGICLRHRDVSC